MATVKRLFRHLFVPALLAAAVWSWSDRARAESWLRDARWGIDFTTAALLLSIALIWIAEQLFPARPDWNYNVAREPVRGLHRVARDLFYLTIVALVNGIVAGFLAAHSARWLSGLGSPALWPSTLPLAARVLLAFLIVELFSYWYHRAAHRFRLLWGFHSTHHALTEVTGIKALRTHPLDNALFYLPRTLPVALLGAGSEELLAATYFGCVLGVLSHANLDVSSRWLGWFINFPGYHFVHHSSSLEESNCNFGCHTVVWDRVFGTFRAAGSDAPVGIAPVRVRTLWQELIWPLYRSVEMRD
jgi:sterol desaturase/sphingolipid hydroxylase (fatty acid hydroxylase superfamily)